MDEIDLIPAEYRRLLLGRRLLGWFGIAMACLAILIGVTRAALGYGIRAGERELEDLRSARAVVLQYKARLAALSGQKTELQRQLALLEGLRGGVAARDMFPLVDHALSAGVWFSSWEFQRAGELVERDPQTVSTGYFIVVPKRAPDDPDRAWRMQTHMQIRGHAQDHSTLAGFVRRLVEQPEIEEARILSTRARNDRSSQVVDFELVLVVNART